MEALTSGRLARQGGVNLQTIRFYERRGLLPRPPRSASGYRLFPGDSLHRLRFIKRAQELGFSLREIKELLAMRVEEDRISCADVRARARSKVVEIEQKIRDLEAMKTALARLVRCCAGRGAISQCPILECFESNSTKGASR